MNPIPEVESITYRGDHHTKGLPGLCILSFHSERYGRSLQEDEECVKGARILLKKKPDLSRGYS
jgi:hypothetical protein